MVQKQLGKKIKGLRSDRGREYLSENFINCFKYRRHKNSAYTSLFGSTDWSGGEENQFWGEAVMTANFIQNRLQWKYVEKTPLEQWYGRQPIYTNIRRFGSKCYVKKAR